MKKTTLKDWAEEFIPLEKLDFVPRSFEIVGDIAIVEIPIEIEDYDKKIGDALLKVNTAIKVVLKKSGIHKGEFRTQDLIWIAGENRKETLYLENGIKLKVNPETVYFSPRLSTERAFLSEQVIANSRVLVMFSGCGPYTFNILKKQPNVKLIDSVEINPEGHKYALENLNLNRNLLKKSDKFKEKIENLKKEKKVINEKQIIEEINNEIIHFYCADIRKAMINELNGKKYDEIFMPLPKDAELFLDCAFSLGDKNCIVHMYDFLHENEFPHKSENAVIEAAKKVGFKVGILSTRKVGQYSPRKYRVCCDFKIL